jgi:hypothetical protein
MRYMGPFHAHRVHGVLKIRDRWYYLLFLTHLQGAAKEFELWFTEAEGDCLRSRLQLFELLKSDGQVCRFDSAGAALHHLG